MNWDVSYLFVCCPYKACARLLCCARLEVPSAPAHFAPCSSPGLRTGLPSRQINCCSTARPLQKLLELPGISLLECLASARNRVRESIRASHMDMASGGQAQSPGKWTPLWRGASSEANGKHRENGRGMGSLREQHGMQLKPSKREWLVASAGRGRGKSCRETNRRLSWPEVSKPMLCEVLRQMYPARDDVPPRPEPACLEGKQSCKHRLGGLPAALQHLWPVGRVAPAHVCHAGL